MNQKNTERFVIFLTSVASVVLLVETLLMGWEKWFLPVIVLGTISLWVIHLLPDLKFRTAFYFLFAVISFYYYGMHFSNFFDLAVAAVLIMASYALFAKPYIIHFVLAEYFALVFYHILNLSGNSPLEFDKLTVSRILLHSGIVLFVYFICIRTIDENLASEEREEEKDKKLEEYEQDMEDFLTNISHELRTPVNVVNGMSDMLIKRNVGYEADAIKRAGIRLAYQIEDIQDYTECKRDTLLLEEDIYMSTSLINDVVMHYRLISSDKDLELVVDLDPKVPTSMVGDIRKIHKIYRHLLENAVKFTEHGGIFVRMYSEPADYGVNLCIEMTDTGIGMGRRTIESISAGMYQANRKRDRHAGGIGLGLNIVYGFVHKMGGFVKIESKLKVGTTVRVTIPQKVEDSTPCLAIDRSFASSLLFHVRPDKYKYPQLRDFYRVMAANLAKGVRVPLYSAETLNDVKRLREKLQADYIFMGQEEYEENMDYFEEIAREGIHVAVSTNADFVKAPGSNIIVMPKPLYAYPIIRILKGEDSITEERQKKLEFRDVRALVVDDEPMNLVVASGIFREYGMTIDTAESGKEAIAKYRQEAYDLVFMDHMMPEMDGVEAMKRLRSAAADMGKSVIIVALTANVVSGAKEMFMEEGFDGFIAKPINVADFERVMLKELPKSKIVLGR